MKKLLGEIQDGAFAKRWIAENAERPPEFDADAQARARAPDREGRRASCAR